MFWPCWAGRRVITLSRLGWGGQIYLGSISCTVTAGWCAGSLMVLATGSSAVNQSVCNRQRSSLQGQVCVCVCKCSRVCLCACLQPHMRHARAQDNGFPAFYQPFGNDGAWWNRRKPLMAAGNLC